MHSSSGALTSLPSDKTGRACKLKSEHENGEIIDIKWVSQPLGNYGHNYNNQHGYFLVNLASQNRFIGTPISSDPLVGGEIQNGSDLTFDTQNS